MTPDAGLRRTLEPLPPNATVTVPVGWLLERLSAPQGHVRQSVEVEIDLTVEQVATLLQKGPCTIRAYCAARLFPNAYKVNGKQWRIPRLSVEAFQRQQQKKYNEQPS